MTVVISARTTGMMVTATIASLTRDVGEQRLEGAAAVAVVDAVPRHGWT
jgi:hypothetical protein